VDGGEGTEEGYYSAGKDCECGDVAPTVIYQPRDPLRW